MNQKTLNKLIAERDELQKRIDVLTLLEGFGVPRKSACAWDPSLLRASSGYSMGELIIFACNGVPFDRIDRRKQYRGKYRGYETHGVLFFNFSKKLLRSIIDSFGQYRKYNYISHSSSYGAIAREAASKKAVDAYIQVVNAFKEAAAHDERSIARKIEVW